MLERPKAVWVILIWYLISNALTCIFYILIICGYIPTKAVFINNPPLIEYIFSVLVSIFEISGAITLFFLQVISFYLLLAGLIISILITIFQLINNTSPAGINSLGFDLGAIAGHAISFAICIYSLHLKNRKIIC